MNDLNAEADSRTDDMRDARLFFGITIALVLPILLTMIPHFCLNEKDYPSWLEYPAPDVLAYLIPVMLACIITDRWTILIGLMAAINFVICTASLIETNHISPLGRGLMLFAYGPFIVLASLIVSVPLAITRRFTPNKAKVTLKKPRSAKTIS